MSSSSDQRDDTIDKSLSDVSSSEAELSSIFIDAEYGKPLGNGRMFQSMGLGEQHQSGDGANQLSDEENPKYTVNLYPSGDAPEGLASKSTTSEMSTDNLHVSFGGDDSFDEVDLNRDISQDSSDMNHRTKILNPKVVAIGFVGLVILIVIIVLVTLI